MVPIEIETNGRILLRLSFVMAFALIAIRAMQPINIILFLIALIKDKPQDSAEKHHENRILFQLLSGDEGTYKNDNAQNK